MTIIKRSPIESATIHYNNALADLPNLAHKIRYQIKPINLPGCYHSLELNQQALGIYAYFVNGNVAELKQHFYTLSLLRKAHTDTKADFFALQLHRWLL